MAQSPPLPVLLFQMVAVMKDKHSGGYPMKKVSPLLLLELIPGDVVTVENASRLSGRYAGSW